MVPAITACLCTTLQYAWPRRKHFDDVLEGFMKPLMALDCWNLRYESAIIVVPLGSIAA